MNQYQTNDANTIQAYQSGQLERTFLEFRMQDGKIQVTDNLEFKKDMEENIYNHFNFMLRISFYHGVFDEITNFVGIYQQQLKQSVELYEYWKEIDQMEAAIEIQVIEAKKRLELLELYNHTPVFKEEFNNFKRQVTFSFLDKEYQIQEAFKLLEEEKARAEYEADARTTVKQGEKYLDWLKQQKPKQQQFKEELDKITNSWSDQYRIYDAGSQFIQRIDENQVNIFIQKSWLSDNWIQQLQQQIQQTLPFFYKLNDQYLICYKYYLTLCEFKENVLINKEIKENLIETAIRMAEKPYIEKFLVYYYDKRNEAQIRLDTLRCIDQQQRLLECTHNINEQLSKLMNAHNNISISVNYGTATIGTRNNAGYNSLSINYVSDVSLNKTQVSRHIEDPEIVKWDTRTIEQEKYLNQILYIIKQLEAKLTILEQLQIRYQQLLQLPKQIELKYKQQFQYQVQQGEIKKAQFSELLNQCQLQNYTSLTFLQQSMPLLLGVFCPYIAIKRDTSCMCCSRKQPHNSDDIFFEDFIKIIASEIRNLLNLENKWFTSNEERVYQTKDLPVIKSSIAFILNHSILGALRNEKGQQQLINGKRQFTPYFSIAKIIEELSQLVIVEQKMKINLHSEDVKVKTQKWKQNLQNAKTGRSTQSLAIDIA